MKNNFNFKVLDFATHIKPPTFKEAYNGKWIEYGEKNLYPIDLLDVYHNKSNKHKAIINRKSKMIYGQGWNTEGVSPEVDTFTKNLTQKENLDDILGKIAYDLEIFGGFALLIKWTNNGEKIGGIKYMPFQNIRVSTDTNKYWHCNDWKQYRKSEYEPVEIQGYDPTISKEEPLQLFYYLDYKPGNSEYPIPNYSSTLNWIEADFEISNFHLNSIQNGFSAGFILNFATGIPTEEEMELAYNEFKRKYSGSGNAGKFILTFSDGADQKPELLPIELNTSDDRFLLLAEQIQQEVMVGHEVTNPQLFGIMVPGQLGGKDQLVESLEIFQSVYIDQKQNQIERCFNKFLSINGIEGTLEIKKYEL
jgi:hypothetical protein